jgi:uncharacterized protein YndB with AHSA1/START domain
MNVGERSGAEREFVISRVFDAPRARVFAAWTDARQVAQWWGPGAFTIPVCEMEVRPGGRFRIVMRSPEGEEYPLKGFIMQVRPTWRLVMRMDCSEHPKEWHDLVRPGRGKHDRDPAGVIFMRAAFEQTKEGTLVTVQLEFESSEIRDSMLKIGMGAGWRESLDKLAALLAVPLKRK